MTHVVYLVMMLTAGGTPQQMGEEASLAGCQAVIQMHAATERGKARTNWYCQQAVSNATLGPSTEK
jgi:hypothetical protein